MTARPAKAVILSRGLGTRMQKADGSASLSGDQVVAADAGVKAMIPVGRPFLDFVLSSIADAGFTDVCIVVGPEHAQLRNHYGVASPPSRIAVSFAIQERPAGTADAVLACESFAGEEPFVVLNSDNYYPSEALAKLRQASPPAIAGFARSGLIELGNVPADRVERFGALDVGEDGCLRSIVPRHPSRPSSGAEVYASMNCWLFTRDIFRVCRDVPLSARGEYELTQAVQLAIDRDEMCFRVVRLRSAVLDLSSRGDIAGVAERLRDVTVSL